MLRAIAGEKLKDVLSLLGSAGRERRFQDKFRVVEFLLQLPVFNRQRQGPLRLFLDFQLVTRFKAA